MSLRYARAALCITSFICVSVVMMACHVAAVMRGDEHQDNLHSPLAIAAEQPANEYLVADVPLAYPNDSTYARVPVTLGMHDSLWFLVDLGATQSVIWPRTLARLGFADTLTRTGTVQGSGGAVNTGVARLDSIRVGSLVRSGINVTVLDIPTQFHWRPTEFALANAPAPDGILGLDLVQDEQGRRYDIEFNFPARRFRLYAYTPRSGPSTSAKRTWAGVRGFVCTPDLESGPISPVERLLRGGLRMVEVTVTVNGHPVRALLDTGAPRSYLAIDVAETVGLTPQSPGVTVKDSGGGLGSKPRPRYRATGVRLTLAGTPLRSSIVYFRGGARTDNYDMLLGLDALADRVVFVAASTGEVCLGPSARIRI